jgi:hypothetical protein
MPRNRRKNKRNVPLVTLAMMRVHKPLHREGQGVLNRTTAFFEQVKRAFDAFANTVQ